VFGFLVAEMALFMLLILPMPFKMKRAMFTWVPPLERSVGLFESNTVAAARAASSRRTP
jgi:hypothetical protein